MAAPLSTVIYLRVTPTQSRMLLSKASRSDLRVATWARKQLRDLLGLPPNEVVPYPAGVKSTGRSRVIFLRVEEDLHNACLKSSLEAGVPMSHWVLKRLLDSA